MENQAPQAGDLSILRWARDAQLSPDGDRVAWVETALDLELDRPVANIMVAPSAGGGPPRRFTEGPGDSAPRWSPDGRYLAYVSVVNDSPVLHLAPLAGGVPLSVETPGPVSFVSWSASGDSLVLVVTVTKDTSATDDPKAKNAPKLVRGLANRLDGRGYLAGRDQLFIYTVEDRSLRQLTAGDYDHRQPCWSPDGTTIVCFSDRTRNRDDDWMFADLWLIPTGGGRSRKVASRVSGAADPSFSPDGKHIAFVGAVGSGTPVGRNPRLLVIPADGSSHAVPLARDLDRPVMAWFPVGNYAWLSNRELLFNVVDRGTISMQRAKLGERLSRPVVAGDLQVTSLTVTKRGGTLLAAFTATWVDKPAEVFCLNLNAEDGRRRQLSDAGKGLLDAVDLLPAKRFSASARDGKEIEYFLISPHSPQSAPPMFLNIHGGPHGWNPFELAFHSYQVLAAAGYAVVLPNPRGSIGYGEQFAMAVNEDWGGEDYHDLLACADDAIRRGLADRDRQFVGGYSYGGYMSAWMVGHTDRFKAACVGAPVIDLVAEFGASDVGPLIAEDLGGDPWHPSGVLQERSPLTHLPNVNTPVFLYVFEGDLRCPPDQADAFFNGLRWHRKEVEYVRYPGGSHMSAADLAAPPSQSEDLLNRMLDFMSQHGGVKTKRAAATTKPRVSDRG